MAAVADIEGSPRPGAGELGREQSTARLRSFASRLAADLDVEAPLVCQSTKGLTWKLLGEVALLRFASTKCTLAYRAEAFQDYYLVKVQKQGCAAIGIGGRSILIGPGDVVLCDGAASHHYEFDDDNEHVCLILPKSVLASRIERRSPVVADMVNRPILGNRPAAAVIRSYAVGLIEQYDGVALTNDDQLVARVLSDAVLSCYTADFEHDRCGFDGWATVQQFVEANLEDPALRPGYICQRLQLRPRHLQALFRQRGTSCHKFIATIRLTEVCRRLRDPEHNRSITDIAYDVGFDDLSYFSRSFRRAFGQSPRQYRKLMIDSTTRRAAASRSTLPSWS